MSQTQMQPGEGYRKANLYRSHPPAPSKSDKILVVFLYIATILLILAGAAGFGYLLPGLATANWGDDTVLVIGNQKVGEGLVDARKREVYINLDTLQEYIDPHIFWDENEKTAVITTEDRVVHMHSEKLQSDINLRPVDLEFPVREEDGMLFLPLLFLANFYELDVDYVEETDTVVIDRRDDDSAYKGRVTSETVCVREGPSIRSPVLSIVGEQSSLRLQEDTGEDWLLVRTEHGITGYMPRQYIDVEGKYIPPSGEDRAEQDKNAEKQLPPEPLVMVWEYVHTRTNTDGIGEMPSLQIVSPTWFHVKDAEGNMQNLADPAYMDWAREQGYHVWALVTNSFDPELTAEVLSSSAARKNIIDQLLIYARLYDLDGLNLDFENFHADYRDLYTQFVRELAPLCREEGLVLSVDVTFISTSTYWSRCYDRRALAESVDYVMVMAYDEHWGASPVAGSVSSLPWVEHGLQRVLKEVPAEKLVLGVPFYTRQWEVEFLEGGGQEVSSQAYSMGRISEIIQNRDTTELWDEDARQNKVIYEEGGKTYKIWLEDTDSMEQRIELVNNYGLAGVAAWRRGFEKPEIWEVIRDVLEDYPR